MTSTSAATSIRARDLEFFYSGASTEPDDAGFHLKLDHWTVARGDQIALYGPSGCGKTTLLKLVAGSLVPARGSLVVEGLEIGTASDAARRSHRIRNIGFVFQDAPLIDSLDVFDNVLLPYRINPALRLDDQARARTRELLTALGIERRARRRPRELSIGEAQRVALARALVTQPTLLLADEPTAGLDPRNTVAVLDLLQGLVAERSLTLILVTHDAAVLERFDHRLKVGGASG